MRGSAAGSAASRSIAARHARHRPPDPGGGREETAPVDAADAQHGIERPRQGGAAEHGAFLDVGGPDRHRTVRLQAAEADPRQRVDRARRQAEVDKIPAQPAGPRRRRRAPVAQMLVEGRVESPQACEQVAVAVLRQATVEQRDERRQAVQPLVDLGGGGAQPLATRHAAALTVAMTSFGSAGAPTQALLAGICSPFITSVSGPSWAKSATWVS